jgi:hypothetical protein
MRLKVHRLGVAASILALLTVAGAAQAQIPSTPSTPSVASSWTTSAVTGVVVSTNLPTESVTIKTDAGSTMTFILASPISMRSAGRDIELGEIKVGDRVRIEPTPGEMTGEPDRTASRLEVMPSGSTQGSTGSPQRSVSTDRPVLGEPADAGGDRPAMPASPGSTTGRSTSTDRPVLGQSPTPSTDAGSTAYGSTVTPTPSPSNAPSTYAQTPSTPPSSAGSSADADADTDREEDLPATASPLPFLGVMGLVALVAGLAARATRKQHS